jgi:hypothetical protein
MDIRKRCRCTELNRTWRNVLVSYLELAAAGDQALLVIEERGLPPGELAEPADWRSRWTELTPPYQDLAGDLS